jgi:hypothetical protein
LRNAFEKARFGDDDLTGVILEADQWNRLLQLVAKPDEITASL